MIRHHPGDALLLAQAGASLDTGPSLLVESHLENCARCRQLVRGFEQVGGQLLEIDEGRFPPVGSFTSRPRPQVRRREANSNVAELLVGPTSASTRPPNRGFRGVIVMTASLAAGRLTPARSEPPSVASTRASVRRRDD